jgi:hypothetical protein
VTIVSTIEIEKTDLDMSGTYQCIGIHEQINSQQSFNIQVIANGNIFFRTRTILMFFLFLETNSIKRNFPEDALITGKNLFFILRIKYLV